MAFNPFKKPIGERLTQEDLQTLVDAEVGEGYYIEYKSIPPKTTKMSHSLASFANTYGGWYVVGVEERDHKAAKIIGFSLTEFRDPLATIRDVARTLIDPVPVFFPQLVKLDSGNVVLVVYIPGEQETPFVTSDGRIYRRTNDASESIPETSRYSLDRLVDNGRDIQRQFANFCQDERNFSEAEGKIPWLSIYIAPYPQGKEPNVDMLSIVSIEELIASTSKTLPVIPGGTDKGSMHMSFEVGLPTFNSVILRQSSPRTVGLNQPSIELFLDGKAKFHLPISYLSFRDLDLQQSRYAAQAGHIFDPKKFEHFGVLRFLDIGQLWLAIMWFFRFYERWLEANDTCTSFRIAAKGKHLWRTVAFVDHEKWLVDVTKLGLPVIQTSTITIPANVENGIVLERDTNTWIHFCDMLSQGFGLTSETFTELFVQALMKAIPKDTEPPKLT